MDRMHAMSDVPTVLLHRDAAVATLTLRNPGRLNAMTRAMWRELRSAESAGAYFGAEIRGRYPEEWIQRPS